MSYNNFDKINTEEKPIRSQFDEETGQMYFSIVDVIDSLGVSKDPRNYWKVLKNRLNKRNDELVTECNQCKLLSSDGKYYLTDVASIGTMLKFIEMLSPSYVRTYEEYFNNSEKKFLSNDKNFFGGEENREDLSTVETDDGEIKIDMYKNNNFIFVNAMLAGVEKENIFISLDCKILTIKFNRQPGEKVDEKNYGAEELSWGRFSRIITLPYEVDIDRVETNFEFGLLSIKLYILDKTRTKIVKV